MYIPIGQIIREELRRQGHTNEWLAERINVHPRTVQKIFLKTSIDTQQLLTISQALDIDFFKMYSNILEKGI
ncbi:MAG: helix-turn-helix domain-containing protein [Bacteroidales bacterium]|nr:helix-turn-helix domain-containing protein [Bacteroidales bacterium]